MTDSGTVDVHIDPYDCENEIRVNLWLSCDVTFASRYLPKPRMHRILLSHHILIMSKSSLPIFFFFLIVVFWHPRDVVTCVWPDDDGCYHTERALRISLHRQRSNSHSRAI